MDRWITDRYCLNIEKIYDQYLFQKFVGVYSMKLEMRTINLDKNVCEHIFSPRHYGLKLPVPKILNFPLESPSQIAPKFNSLVEQCRTKIQI